MNAQCMKGEKEETTAFGEEKYKVVMDPIFCRPLFLRSIVRGMTVFFSFDLVAIDWNHSFLH